MSSRENAFEKYDSHREILGNKEIQTKINHLAQRVFVFMLDKTYDDMELEMPIDAKIDIFDHFVVLLMYIVMGELHVDDLSNDLIKKYKKRMKYKNEK